MNKKLSQSEKEEAEVAAIAECVDNPILWIKAMWELTPQPFKSLEFYKLSKNTPLKDWKAEWFGKFVKGKHFSWQQYVILLGVRRAERGEDKELVSVASGKGIGKSCVLSWIILWFLLTHESCLIPCTAPSESQLFGALWKELRVWHSKMPEVWKNQIEITDNYARVVGAGKEKSKTWWARAKTARDDNPEALAGIHADNVLIVVDEASAVSNETFVQAEGALTSPHLIMIMITNPTRTTGYFYESHNKDKESWQTFIFSNLDAPAEIANPSYAERVRKKYGEDSPEFRSQILGLFPREDAADTKGYMRLIEKGSLKVVSDQNYKFNNPRMGVDPAGMGSNSAVWVIRDNFRCKRIGGEKVSNPMQVAQKTMGLIDAYGIKAKDVYIDSFGSDVVEAIQILERHGHRVNAIQVGDDAEDESLYENKKAENYDRMREWTNKGGEYLGNHSEWEDIFLVRKKQAGKMDRMKIKTKEEMRRDKEPSPNTAEAVMLTFHDDDEDFSSRTEEDRTKSRDSYMESRKRLMGVKL